MKVIFDGDAVSAAAVIVGVHPSRVFSAATSALTEEDIGKMLGLAALLVLRASNNRLSITAEYLQLIKRALDLEYPYLRR